MPVSKNINTYSDVRKVLDALAARGGTGRFRTNSKAAAIQWRLRANTFRALEQKRLASVNMMPGYTPPTPYDGMLFRIDKVDPCVVIIDQRAIVGTLEDADGKTISLESDLDEAAKNLRLELGIKDDKDE